MRDLTAEELSDVSGGNRILDFFVGYIASKALDAGAKSIAESAKHNTIVPVYGTTQYNGTYFNVPNEHELAKRYS